MDTYSASLHAEYVHNELLQAHAYGNAQDMQTWEIGAIERALKHLDILNALAPAVRDRLAALQSPPEASDVHASDCALHNEPALPNGPCDCGADVLAILQGA